MKNRHWSTQLPKTACAEAVAWAKTQATYEAAWDACKRGDWLLWLAARGLTRGSDEHRAVVLAGCQCARLALPHVRAGDRRPLAAIAAAERWARREPHVTLERVHAAASAAAAAASAAASAASAYAAAYAASAYAAAYAASDAASAAWEAGNASAYAAARTKTLHQCAILVRSIVARPELAKGRWRIEQKADHYRSPYWPDHPSPTA